MTTIETTTQTKRAKKSKAPAGPVPKTFERDLEVSLTDAERLKRNEDLLEAMQARDDLKAQKSDATSLINAAIKTSEGKVKDLAVALRSGKEKRPVRCTERFLFETNTVEIVRTDTHAVIEKRAMTPEERQPALFTLRDDVAAAVAAAHPNGLTKADLTATVGEIAKAKNGAPAKGADACPKELEGVACTRPAGHRGAHGFKDPSPKA